MAAGPSQAQTARERWELENSVDELSASDALFVFDEQRNSAIQQQRPWRTDPHYFKHVKVSALALLKMAMHARSGGNIEVMGMLQGKVLDDTFVIMDTFALPVEGTETRVNAAAEANEYMVQFMDTQKMVGRKENICGWYHSHPGYGCWLSGIDVNTQMTNQQYQEPFLAIVIDPHRTMAAGKVDIGAFRTYPEGYKPPDEPASEYQTIPLNKIEDFGVHAKQYYSLDITFFKSSLDAHMLDLLWNKYWVNTLSSSPLLGNRDFVVGQISDLGEKLEQAESQLVHSGRIGGFLTISDKKKEDNQLQKITVDSTKMAVEQIKGLSSQVVKDMLFNYRPKLTSGSCGPAPMEM
mmetsp:Transcript_25326/g.70833  ORF Transcript_25326/g.70833 Transcript_25326/m.70833 type:complete len:351 (+) Transcript_25326:120-1172(+)|eukprot:CAMPEP_0117670194 /NCGR_PEP_ID=MMETSP0804-20121206/12599_1 /TAXON_ID=1074897 /ORGANISM="Tetraselmis astigmatica, Strain CCMP880" /LENGTH=350 /DNA_ID=CAMNT_0005478429 /DNA_START=56 /DNA_END=1108 /DNA_ORIENTATION=+